MNKFYRQDIDGLRGICVMAVLVFHIFPEILPAGFLGVDIFFGISGYLICQLILRQIKNQNFSVLGFFGSRIRRIFPALILVLLFCVLVGSYLLPFDEFRQLNLHIATGTVFSSNFLLANEIGYFDTASTRKPLLHLWSLAVEEQFYLIFPFAILLLTRFKLRISYALFFLAILSYSTGVYIAQNNPDDAYFLSWCRFYEILAGAALAAGVAKQTAVFKTMVAPTVKTGNFQSGRLLLQHENLLGKKSVWSVIGLALICVSFFVFDRNNVVPGISTLLPLLGLLILLSTGSEAWVNQRVLSARWLVAIGKISYPLYLWHWPIWVFIAIKFQATIWAGLATIASSFLLAIMTYQFVERPIRNGLLMTSKAYVLMLLMLIIGMVSIRTYETGVYRVMQNDAVLDSATLAMYQQRDLDANIKLNWKPNNQKIIVLGDSQAKDLFKSWKNDENIGLLMFNSAYHCSAFTYADKDLKRHADYCRNKFELLVNSEELKEADVLVYAHLWRAKYEFIPGYQEGLERIRKVNPKLKIYFMGLNPCYGIAMSQLMR